MLIRLRCEHCKQPFTRTIADPDPTQKIFSNMRSIGAGKKGIFCDDLCKRGIDPALKPATVLIEHDPPQRNIRETREYHSVACATA